MRRAALLPLLGLGLLELGKKSTAHLARARVAPEGWARNGDIGFPRERGGVNPSYKKVVYVRVRMGLYGAVRGGVFGI